MSEVECTNSMCEETATKVMTWPMSGGTCAFVAPYCDTHAEEIRRGPGGAFACGPALSEDIRSIEGVRR